MTRYPPDNGHPPLSTITPSPICRRPVGDAHVGAVVAGPPLLAPSRYLPFPCANMQPERLSSIRSSPRSLAKAQFLTGAGLGGAVDVGRADDGDHGVAAGERVIGQEQRRQPRRGDLQCTTYDAFAG